MLTIAETAKAITATRADFRMLFMQMQIEVGLPSGERESFDVIASSPDDKTAFEQALTYAQGKNWFKLLIDLIIASGLEDGTIAAAQISADPGSPLQATVDSSRGYMLPNLVTRGVNQGTRWTAKIEIDGVSRGTGILVSNNRLLTAWHVVREVFKLDANGQYEPDQAAAPRIEVVFTDFMDYLARGNQLRGRGERRIQAHADWCVFFSNCHQDELVDRLPENLQQLDGYWDYAIIRLAEPIGLERGWLILDEKASAPYTGKMWLFQHPRGQSARLDFEDITELTPPVRAVIPGLRFLHKVNSDHGSSGGPCFDKTLTCFGFHQGVWDGKNPVINRGVPLVGVLEHLKKNFGVAKLEPEDSLIWRLGPDQEYAPVIGSDLFQSQVLNSSIHGTPRIFTIWGDSGRGKTFHVDLAAALLPNITHLKIEFSAKNLVDKDAAGLANMIAKEAGAGTLELQPLSDFLSTPNSWLSDEVTVRVMAALERVRNGRMVWIFIKDLNVSDLEGTGATQLLSLLYQQVKESSWLRFVLDGMRADIPDGLKDFAYRHRVQDITSAHIETYLRRLATFLGLEMGGGILTRALELHMDYETEAMSHPENAARGLAQQISKKVVPIWEKISKGGR